jgi:hypothetical protein
MPPPAFNVYKPGNPLPETFTHNPVDRELNTIKKKKKSQAVLRKSFEKKSGFLKNFALSG